MTTINTIEDVLRAVREDREVRAALRRELLTEELLALPQQVSALTKSMEAYRETTDQRISALTKSVEATNQQVSALTKSMEAYRETTDQRISALTKSVEAYRETTDQRISALTKSTEAYREATDRQFDIIVNRLDRQHEMYRRQHDDLARFRGNYAVDAARNSDMEIAELFAQLRGMRRIQVRALNKDELDEMLNENYEAVEALRLRDMAWRTFPKSDIIAEVTDRGNSRPGFFIAVEASYTGSAEDALKATDHAKILRHATGRDAYAVVAGVRMGPSVEGRVFDEIARFVEADDDGSAFWYPLDEDELEPPDPY